MITFDHDERTYRRQQSQESTKVSDSLLSAQQNSYEFWLENSYRSQT